MDDTHVSGCGVFAMRKVAAKRHFPNEAIKAENERERKHDQP